MFKETFNKKFSNFCRKAPIFLSYVQLADGVDIYLHRATNSESNKPVRKREKIFHYDFDFDISIKENIFNIRKELVKNWYPIMVKKVTYEKPVDSHSLNKMVEEGEITLNDIGSMGIISQKEVQLRIERVIIMKDILFVRNLETGIMSSYKTRMPVSVFLRKIQEKTEEEREEYFRRKVIFLREIEEDDLTSRLFQQEKE